MAVTPFLTACIVLYATSAVVYAVSLVHFWRRRHLPIIRHRSPLLSVVSAVFSFLLLTLLFTLVLADLDPVPSHVSLILGIVFSSGFARPFIVRTWILSKTIDRNNMQEFPSMIGDSQLNLTFIKTERTLSSTTKLALQAAFSLAVDFVTIMTIIAVRPELGFASRNDLRFPTGYLVLQDWYVFLAFLVVFAAVLAMTLKKRAQQEIFGIFWELVGCLLVCVVTFLVYIGSFYGSFAALFEAEPTGRYLILGLMLLSTFLITTTFPVVRSFRSDSFQDAIPEMDSKETTPRPSHDISLKSILENDALASSFQVFVAKELSAENLFFYRMVEKYRKPNPNITPEVRRNWAQTIANRYVVPGCVTEVNLNEHVKDRILTALKEDQVTQDLFNEAQKQVFDLMERDSLPRFLKESTVREGTLRHELINPTASSGISSVVIITAL